jgi:hypothetical protein
MVRNHPLAKSISDAGWGFFLSILIAKAASAGRVVVEVHPAGTSQMCAQCGETVPKRLAVRWHSCPYCGCELHRDQNAALTILKKGGGTAFGEALPMGGPETENPAPFRGGSVRDVGDNDTWSYLLSEPSSPWCKTLPCGTAGTVRELEHDNGRTSSCLILRSGHDIPYSFAPACCRPTATSDQELRRGAPTNNWASCRRRTT